MEPVSSLTSIQLIKICGMAIFGAIVHSLIAQRKGETKGIFDIIILAFISSFGGVIGGFLILSLYPTNELYLLMGAGMGGYLGTEGLTYLVNLVRHKFTKP